MNAARPFLKWAGGKGQLLPELTRRLPPQIHRYHEPFLGGGALFFHLWNLGRLRHGALLSDFNPELVLTYQIVRDDVEALIDLLQREYQPHVRDKAFFYEVRAWDRAEGFAQRSPLERAARMLFLNRTCYNGLYRLNNKGFFNAPFGHYKNPVAGDPANLRAASAALQCAELRVADFGAVLEVATKDDFVYFDPPYVPLSRTASFTAYTHRGFGEAEQQRVAAVFHALVARECHVMLSNSDCEFSRELFGNPPDEADTVPASRRINCDGARRGNVNELIAYNYKVPGPIRELSEFELAIVRASSARRRRTG